MRVDRQHQDYYVYVLFRETGLPFYVGKGRGYRYRDHFKPSRSASGRNLWKRRIIEAMQASGVDVPVVFVAEGLDEMTALAYERAYIKAIGRHPDGPLVNLTDGGDGVSGYVFDREMVERIAVQRRGRPSPKKGVKVTCPIALANIAAASQKRFETQSSPWKGKTPTAETRAKMSAAKKGKRRTSPAQIANDQALRGKPGPNRGRKFGPPDSITLARRQETRLFNLMQAQTPFTSEVYLHG